VQKDIGVYSGYFLIGGLTEKISFKVFAVFCLVNSEGVLEFAQILEQKIP
jgi:hypothetical protein